MSGPHNSIAEVDEEIMKTTGSSVGQSKYIRKRYQLMLTHPSTAPPAPHIASPRLGSIMTDSLYPPFILYSSLIARSNSMANLLDKKDSNSQPSKIRGDTPWKIRELTITPKMTLKVMSIPEKPTSSVRNPIPIWVVIRESMWRDKLPGGV